MYLHLGQNVMVKSDEIVGVFDMDFCTVNKTTKKYLYNAEKEKRVTAVSVDLPKSFVICASKNSKLNKIFISPLATSTLVKRHEMRSLF